MECRDQVGVSLNELEISLLPQLHLDFLNISRHGMAGPGPVKVNLHNVQSSLLILTLSCSQDRHTSLPKIWFNILHTLFAKKESQSSWDRRSGIQEGLLRKGSSSVFPFVETAILVTLLFCLLEAITSFTCIAYFLHSVVYFLHFPDLQTPVF